MGKNIYNSFTACCCLPLWHSFSMNVHRSNNQCDSRALCDFFDLAGILVSHEYSAQFRCNRVKESWKMKQNEDWMYAIMNTNALISRQYWTFKWQLLLWGCNRKQWNIKCCKNKCKEMKKKNKTKNIKYNLICILTTNEDKQNQTEQNI